MKRKRRVSVLMDWAAIPDADPDFRGPPAGPTTEYHVVGALRELGYETGIIGVNDDVAPITAGLAEQRPDIVFNLTETFRQDRQFDANVAALLEMTGIPFTGTGSTGMMLCRDKGLCKQLLSRHRVRVPGFVSMPPGRAVRVGRALSYPMVVKPALADGSDGIANASLVTNENALRDRVQWVHEHWRQPAIVEEYVEGRELYIAVLGNKRLEVLPGRELFFSSEDGNGPLLATYRVKWDSQYQEKWGIKFGFAELDDAVFAKIARVSRSVYRVLQLRDFGRIDLRLTPDGRIVILEANPNPDIAFGEEVAEAAERAGIAYPELIERILRMALRRSAKS